MNNGGKQANISGQISRARCDRLCLTRIDSFATTSNSRPSLNGFSVDSGRCRNQLVSDNGQLGPPVDSAKEKRPPSLLKPLSGNLKEKMLRNECATR